MPESKKPISERWPTRKPDENDVDDIHSENNIGIVLGDASNDIVYIDLETLTALELAPFFLPETEQTFGRQSAPESQWINRLKGDAGRRKAFKLSRHMLAEYCGSGCYTVFADIKAMHKSR